MFLRSKNRRCRKPFTLSFWAKGTNPPNGYFENEGKFWIWGNSVSGVGDTGHGFLVIQIGKNYLYIYTTKYFWKNIRNNSLVFECQILNNPAGEMEQSIYNRYCQNVQLEVGKNATEFEKRPIGEDLIMSKILLQMVFKWSYSNFELVMLRCIKRRSCI